MSRCRRMLSGRTVAGIAIGALLAVTVHCGGKDPAYLPSTAVGEASNPTAPVVVDTVRRGRLVLEIEATGQVEPDRRAEVVARTEGRVVAVRARSGERVRAGDALVLLDPRALDLAVERARAEVEEARVRFREGTLFDDRIQDPAKRARRRAAVRARSGLTAAEVNLRQALLERTGATLTAPFAGRVADVEVSPGTWVERGRRILAVVDADPARVEVRVSERDLAGLAADAPASVLLPALPDTVLEGGIAGIDPVVEPESRTVGVRVAVPNPRGAILPGMYARVRLAGRAFPNRILVSRRALLERDGRTLVFLVVSDREGGARARWTYVTPGRANRRSVAIVPGPGTEVPPEGALVVVDGGEELVHGAPVRIVREADP